MIHGILSEYRVVYRYLWGTYGRTWQYRLSFVLQIIKNAVKFMLLPIAISQILANLAAGQFDAAFRSVLLFACGSATIGLVAPFVKYVGMIGENRTYREETARYFKHLVSADVEYFNSNLAGYLTTTTRQYVDSGVRIVRALRDSYAQTAMAFVFPIVVIFTVNWQIGLVVALLGAALLIYMLWSSHVLEPYRLRSREIYKKNSGVMADAISNIVTVKSAGREDSVATKIGQNANIESDAFTKRYVVQTKLTAGREAVTVVAYTFVLLGVVWLASTGELTLQGSILIATYITPVLTAIYAIADAVGEHDDLLDQLLPGLELFERTHAVLDVSSPDKFQNIKGDIRFEDVRFSYEKRQGAARCVLNEFSLTIPAGQKIGVVGLSGAGKSTMARLLLRFADLDEGRVLIDGIDISKVKQADLRRNVAYVPQEPLLFHASIRDNILFSRADATEKDLQEALKMSYADEFVHGLPHGLESIVGERGVKLSGGQKQRIAIARAVMQNAPIIVLDEATSALDSESERIIKSSFKQILKGKTAIVVAHRLSTLSDMDRIIVISNGKVAEDGTHEELLKNGGLYASLWKQQQKYESIY